MIKVIDGFCPIIDEVKERIKAITYRDVMFEGVMYPDLCLTHEQWAHDKLSEAMGGKVIPVFEYYRRYMNGRVQPSFIHSDGAICRWNALWSPKDNNGSFRVWKPITDNPDGLDHNAWELIEEVELKENRCVIYEAATPHSRWPVDWTGEQPRIVLVFFFNVRPNKEG